jgi:DNA polymerase III delta subunit
MTPGETPSGSKARKKRSRAAASPRCLVLVGDEEFFVREEIERVREAIFGGREAGPSFVDVACKARPGEESLDPKSLLDELRTAPLFGGAKLVCVRQPEALVEEDLERLLATMSRLPAGVHAILCLSKLRKSSKLEKRLATLGEIRRVRALYDRPGPWERGRAEHDSELTQWLCRRAEARRLRLSPEDAYRLVRKIGNHPARLESEIEKLSLLLGPDASVGAREIDALAAGAGEFKAFDLADAIVERDTRRALGILEAILAEGMVGWGNAAKIQSLGGIAPLVVGAVRSKILDVLRARSLVDSGRSRREVLEALRAPGFLKETLLRQAGLHTAARLERLLEELLEFDRLLKGGSEFPEACLERMVVTLSR